MLKYIWMVTEDLFVTVTLVTWMHAMLGRLYGAEGRLTHKVGIWVGLASSIVFAAFKNGTNKIISSHWNHYICLLIMALSLLFLVLTLIFGRGEKKAFTAGGAIYSACGALLSAIWIFYKLPGVMLYPFNFNTMGNGYLSWYYAERLGGWLLALVVLYVYSVLLHKCTLRIKRLAVPVALYNAAALINSAYCFGFFFAPWITRAKWLKWPVKYNAAEHGIIRDITMFATKNADLFILLTAALVLLMAALYFAENLKIVDKYENRAQLRKLKARNRHNRRQTVGTVALLACAVISVSAVKAYDTRVIELSPPETYTVEDDRILIPVDTVSDGHLHRFEYRTENNVDVRWIVVKKPGSASFGTGLDACEVCGNAGYYERNGQVICKRCDVVMNINTIGFRGGCNPIPLGYELVDGNVVFKLDDIIAGEREFK